MNTNTANSAPSPRRRLGRRQRLAFGIGALVLVGVLFLFPEPRPRVPQASAPKPFAWKQDEVWTGLEREFVVARTIGCAAVASRIEGVVDDINDVLAELGNRSVPPESPLFTELETNLFHLAALVAACPERLNDFTPLVTRTRAAVKQQSERWNVDAPASRERLYRLLFGSRIALEEAMLQTATNVALPTVVLGTDEPSRTPSATLLGVTLHSGDILLSRGGAATSALIARGNDFPGNFSHVALLHVDEQTGKASVIEAHIECGVAVASFDDYIRDKKLRVLVLRLRADLPALAADPMLPHRAASHALAEARRRHIPYDFAMDWRDHDAQFCSEVAAAAYESCGIRLWMGLSQITSPTVRAWLASLGVRHFETQEPSDLEYDPQLRVVAEWRDRATLLKAHVDDAVTDVMLAAAKPGEPLPYSWLGLPRARLGKAYSFVLNAAGKVGPIPEGMSATTALRVEAYRHDHALLADRVLASAEEFRTKRDYTPPYWELVRLAEQARIVEAFASRFGIRVAPSPESRESQSR